MNEYYYEVSVTYADDPESNTSEVLSLSELVSRYPWIGSIIEDDPELFTLSLVQGLRHLRVSFPLNVVG